MEKFMNRPTHKSGQLISDRRVTAIQRRKDSLQEAVLEIPSQKYALRPKHHTVHTKYKI